MAGLPFVDYVTLGKLLNLLGCHFAQIQHGDNDCTSLIELFLGFGEIMAETCVSLY